MTIMKVREDDPLIKLSASSMKTVDQCPLKYYYQYIEKAPKREWSHLKLGNLVHKALEIFHKMILKGDNRPLGQIMKDAFAKARVEEKIDSSDILMEAKALLGDYLKSIKNKMPNVRGIEVPFKIKIAENVLVRGFIDRVDVLNDGMFHIVDYKTTKNEKYLDAFQLLVYGLWLKHKKPEVSKFKASYILLKHKSKYKSYMFNVNDIDNCKKKVLGFAEKINNNKAENKWVPVPTRLCNWCDFMPICKAHEDW